ncbi:hypothetical protein [Hyalangium versicolor]|uniref:hypothetical protein n=1 Tax=Hyalangium versicolor TaxID=2861190 RepID=UPI001CCB6A02|nr:hypothetical protein [Hyalangium versicolor]
MNGYGYIVGPDGTLWTTVGNTLNASLVKRAPGEAQWRHLIDLSLDNLHVYVPNQGHVFLVESGIVLDDGVYKLVSE